MHNPRRLTIRLPEELYQHLKNKAEWREENDTDSVAAEIRLLIRQDIASEGGRNCAA